MKKNVINRTMPKIKKFLLHKMGISAENPSTKSNHQSHTTQPMTPNQHIKDYLSYYLQFSTPPHFAILLNGPWGIGKTYLVTEFVESLNDDSFKYVYVSLYGLTSLEEIDDAIFQSMFPILENKGIQIGSRAIKALGKYVNLEIDLKSTDFLNRAGSDLYIFDDLERCDMPINSVMGYINSLVEHDGRKVIIIANEDEIKEAKGYSRIREKLIGKTFHIQSVFDEAINTFIASIKNRKTRHSVELNSSFIAEIYHQSGLNNLRVLQQTIWDFERIHECLDERHQTHNMAMTSLVGILFALSFEVKAGRLHVRDFHNREKLLIRSLMQVKHEGGKALPIDVANQRYPTIDLGSTILSDKTLINIMSKGIIDQRQIKEDLDQSSFFVIVAQEPCWRTVWHSHDRTEDEVNSSLAEMERAFKEHEFTLTGEILHVFGIRLRLSEIGALSITKDAVIIECKQYVDWLYANQKLELPPTERTHESLYFNSYGGLGIQEADTAEYGDVHKYMQEMRQKANIDRHPMIAEELLADLANDPTIFLRRVCVTNDGNNDLHDVPILATLDAQRFVNEILSLHPSLQRTAMLALKLRYEKGHIDEKLAAERNWAIKVKDLLLAAADKMGPISKTRVQGLVTHGFGKTIDESAIKKHPH